MSHRFETDAGHLCDPNAVNGRFCKHLGTSRGKLKLLKIGAAKVPTVKQIFRNAAHAERTIDSVSNSAGPAFLSTFESNFSEKVPYQGQYGDFLDIGVSFGAREKPLRTVSC